MIPLRTATSVYAVLRTAAAVPAGVFMWRDRQEPLALLAQAGLDAAAVLFVLALSHPRLREAVGGWWLLIFPCAVLWEGLKFRSQVDDIMNPPASAADAFSMQAAFTGWEALGRGVYGILGVVFPLALGFGLCCDVLFGTTFVSK